MKNLKSIIYAIYRSAVFHGRNCNCNFENGLDFYSFYIFHKNSIDLFERNDNDYTSGMHGKNANYTLIG